MAVKIELMVSKGLKATVTGQNVKEAINELNMFAEVPHECPRCKAPIAFKHREVDGNHFYEVVCRGKVEHKSTLGVHRQGDTLYYKNSENWKTMDEIKNENGGSNQRRQPTQKPKPEPDQSLRDLEGDDDLPF